MNKFREISAKFEIDFGEIIRFGYTTCSKNLLKSLFFHHYDFTD